MTPHEQKALVEDFYMDLKDSGATINISRSGVISVNEEKVQVRNCLTFLQTRCRTNPRYNPLLLMEVVSFLNYFRMVHSQAQRNAFDYSDVEVRNYNYEGLIPFQSVTDVNRYVLFDTATGTVTDLDFKTFKENPDTRNIQPIRGRIEFNPYSPKPIDHREDQFGRPCNFLNTYKKPSWQLVNEISAVDAVKYKPPQLFVDFMKHLFPDLECRTFVLDWLHYALTDRCETYLVLNGAKGIGKNLFSENLCKSLLGANNHKIAQMSALTSDFTALLKDARMIVFDEFRVDTPDKINRLKRYVNEEQMIENKGKDVGETAKTFNSFIISNNDAADMKISWDDRRFSVADLTKVKLREVWDKEKIDELVSMFKSDEFMRDIGYFIMYRKPKTSKYDAYKGKHFYELCYTSFAEWQKIIIDFATSREYVEITNVDLKREYRKRVDATRLPGYSKVKDFIENYRHDGEWSIGEVYKQGGDVWVIELSEKFAATGEIRMGENKEEDKGNGDDDDLLA